MSPTLAAILTAIFIVGLFVLDARGSKRQSAALWIAVAWLFFTGTRFVSQWLALGQPVVIEAADGSAIDALFFLACIVLSAIVLLRRRVHFTDVVRRNAWVLAFLLFGLISVVWSDFPYVSFKRWVKVLGHPLVALVILTDPDPRKALAAVMKRCAFLVLPLSVLFIKYYPEYGRGFDAWTGEGFYSGVGLNKNYLGYLSMTFAIFFVWHFLVVRKLEDIRERRKEVMLSCMLVPMALWLLYVSDSATSLATTVIGVATLLVLGWRIVNKRYVFAYAIAAVAACLAVEIAFDGYETIIAMLGRDPNLTDRTEVWADALALQPNVLLGAGFESFWMGSRLDILWQKWWWRPNQAHNGYIETYLNLGLVGVAILAGLLLATFRQICRQFLEELDTARLRMAFLLVLLFYNYTEAAFKGVHFMWTIFYIIAMVYPAAAERRVPSPQLIHGRMQQERKPFSRLPGRRSATTEGVADRFS